MKSRGSKWVRGIEAVVLIGGLVMGTVLVLAATTQAGDPIDDPTRQPHLKSWSNVIPAARRFVVLADFNNAAVLDRETGLVWERLPASIEYEWGDARLECINRTTGNRKGWRLPSAPELASLIDPSAVSSGVTLPAGHPFIGVQSIGYWSATTNAEDPSAAWVAFFQFGNVGSNPKTVIFTHPIWCVRGGMNADQY